ncbi:MAG: hypothetical protein ACLGPL_05255, partial [Acidobacteriota bacterium]
LDRPVICAFMNSAKNITSDNRVRPPGTDDGDRIVSVKLSPGRSQAIRSYAVDVMEIQDNEP